MMDMAQGKAPHLWAALKSLPFAPEADEAGSGEDHLQLACELLAQCRTMLDSE
jgi:hypothetical protein